MTNFSDNLRMFREIKIAAVMNMHLVASIIGFVMLCLDFYLNFIRKASTSSLSVSYQLAENRRIIRILLPIELVETFLGFFTAISQIVYGKIVSNPTPIERQIFLELTTPVAHFPFILTFFIKYSVQKSVV
ncbi:hypothetical protein PMAYCL1PPCAC_21853, partial [Pristionchus mayeri]